MNCVSPETVERVAKIVGHSHEEGRLDADMRFCPRCGEPSLDWRTVMGFLCADCGYSGVRALTFRKNARFTIRDGLLFHYSVGTAVLCRFEEESEDRILLLRRSTYPVKSFHIPSGHWDLEDRDPLAAARREVKEESGVTASSWELVSKPYELLEEGCRGASDHHYWHFFRCLCPPARATLRMTVDRKSKVIGESDMIGWIPVGQVCAGEFQLTKPSAYFLGQILGAAIPNEPLK